MSKILFQWTHVNDIVVVSLHLQYVFVWDDEKGRLENSDTEMASLMTKQYCSNLSSSTMLLSQSNLITIINLQ